MYGRKKNTLHGAAAGTHGGATLAVGIAQTCRVVPVNHATRHATHVVRSRTQSSSVLFDSFSFCCPAVRDVIPVYTDGHRCARGRPCNTHVSSDRRLAGGSLQGARSNGRTSRLGWCGNYPVAGQSAVRIFFHPLLYMRTRYNAAYSMYYTHARRTKAR
jgi:hypothetical protein